MVTSVSVIVEYATLLARSVPTRVAEALSRPKVRLEAWSTMTSPGPGKPVSRQWPLVMTSAWSLSAEPGKRMTEPEQLLSETVPAKPTALTAGAGVPAVDAGAATAGAAPAPVITRAKSAAPRGLFMWGSPLTTWATGDLPAARNLT